MVIRCCSNPTDSTSITYDLFIPMFKEGNLKEWLKWVKNVKRAAKGQNMTTEPTKFALPKHLLDGRALIAFENAATAFESETNNTFK